MKNALWIAAGVAGLIALASQLALADGKRSESSTTATPVNVYGSAGVVLQTSDAGVLKVESDVTAAEGDTSARVLVPLTGKGPDGKVKALSLSAAGNLYLTDKACSSVAQSIVSVGAAAVVVPAAPLQGRRYIRICVSPENVGSPYVKCLLGGDAPVIGIANPGDVIPTGECVPYTAASTDTIKCIGSAAGVGVTTFECS